MAADIKPLLTAIGTLAGLAQAEAGNAEAQTDTTAFTDAYAAVDKTKKPTIEDWTNTVFNVADGIVAALPDSDTKTKLIQLFADAKQLILNGEQGKGWAAFTEAVSVLHDLKAFKKA